MIMVDLLMVGSIQKQREIVSKVGTIIFHLFSVPKYEPGRQDVLQGPTPSLPIHLAVFVQVLVSGTSPSEDDYQGLHLFS